MTTHDIMRSVNSRIEAKEKMKEREIKFQRKFDSLPDCRLDPPEPTPCYDVFVDTGAAAEDELRNALDGDGDRILTALDLLDLNGAVIQMIIDNAENLNDERAALYGLEGLYEKLTGESLGIKENL